MIYVTNVPLENNYFSRILSGNKVVVTIHQIKEILEEAEVPLENFIIAMLYAYSLMYLSSQGSMNMAYENSLAHNDANGCIFNQCGNKKEVVETCLRPHLCDVCKSHFLNNSVPTEQLKHINSKLRKLDRPIYYRLKYFIKKRPILALAISAISAIILSLIAGLLLELLTK